MHVYPRSLRADARTVGCAEQGRIWEVGDDVVGDGAAVVVVGGEVEGGEVGGGEGGEVGLG